MPGVDIHLSGRPGGPLDGLTFAAKDLFDVQGLVTGCGNPDWAATHTAAERSAAAVEALLNAGATLVGKTITDEISLGLLGINRFYGTPLNSRAPERVPGGSSSGSASAVVGGACDVALGTDSGGSVRVPASFCGSVRTSSHPGPDRCAGHDGPVPDVRHRGLFHSRPGDLRQDRRGSPGRTHRPRVTCGDYCRDRCVCACGRGRARRAGPRCRSVSTGRARYANIHCDGRRPLNWARWQRVLQRHEFRATFRDWIDRVNPRFSAKSRALSLTRGRHPPRPSTSPLASASKRRRVSTRFWTDERRSAFRLPPSCRLSATHAYPSCAPRCIGSSI